MRGDEYTRKSFRFIDFYDYVSAMYTRRFRRICENSVECHRNHQFFIYYYFSFFFFFADAVEIIYKKGMEKMPMMTLAMATAVAAQRISRRCRITTT